MMHRVKACKRAKQHNIFIMRYPRSLSEVEGNAIRSFRRRAAGHRHSTRSVERERNSPAPRRRGAGGEVKSAVTGLFFYVHHDDAIFHSMPEIA